MLGFFCAAVVLMVLVGVMFKVCLTAQPCKTRTATRRRVLANKPMPDASVPEKADVDVRSMPRVGAGASTLFSCRYESQAPVNVRQPLPQPLQQSSTKLRQECKKLGPDDSNRVEKSDLVHLLMPHTSSILSGDDEISQQNVAMLSPHKLRAQCKKFGLDDSKCIEKRDLVDLMMPHIPRRNFVVVRSSAPLTQANLQTVMSTVMSKIAQNSPVAHGSSSSIRSLLTTPTLALLGGPVSDATCDEDDAMSQPFSSDHHVTWDNRPASSTHHRLCGCFDIDMGHFAPAYDYDFTDIDPATEQDHYRGGEQYFRPIGWKKIGLDVSAFSKLDRCSIRALKEMLRSRGFDHIIGQAFAAGTEKSELVKRAKTLGLSDDVDGARWLGSTGTDPLEWCVAYHGTGQEAAKHIARSGLKAGGGSDPTVGVKNGAAWGRGVYCTPDVTVAEEYAEEVQIDSDEGSRFYQIIFQCRVHGPAWKSHDEAAEFGGFFKVGLENPDCYAKNYWVVPKESDVRPYAILIRQVEY
jgi:hypothetical protein